MEEIMADKQRKVSESESQDTKSLPLGWFRELLRLADAVHLGNLDVGDVAELQGFAKSVRHLVEGNDLARLNSEPAMTNSNPQPQPNTTTDIDEQIDNLLKEAEDVSHEKRLIKNLIAQEANKARIDELEKCVEVILFHSGGVMTKEKAEKMWHTHIDNRFKLLTAEKGKA
jgi:hypothetical protein